MIKENNINIPKLLGVGVAKNLCLKVSQLGPKSHILVINRSKTIPWA